MRSHETLEVIDNIKRRKTNFQSRVHRTYYTFIFIQTFKLDIKINSNERTNESRHRHKLILKIYTYTLLYENVIHLHSHALCTHSLHAHTDTHTNKHTAIAKWYLFGPQIMRSDAILCNACLVVYMVRMYSYTSTYRVRRAMCVYTSIT